MWRPGQLKSETEMISYVICTMGLELVLQLEVQLELLLESAIQLVHDSYFISYF